MTYMFNLCKTNTKKRKAWKISLLPAYGILNEITPFKSVSKFPCQPSLPTPASLSFPRIPTFASLV